MLWSEDDRAPGGEPRAHMSFDGDGLSLRKRFEDHRICDPTCRDAAVPSPLVRDRPPQVPCKNCGAAAGVACTVRGPGRRRALTRFGRSHPSRLERVE